MKAYIKALSYYLPERTLSNEDLAKEFPEWDAEKVYSKVGVKCRHLAAENETACDLAEKASLRMFAEYGINPAIIDFVLVCTQSPDYRLPSTACILQDRLCIPKSAGAFDYNLGCSGCIYGLATAKGLIAAGIANNVLLITSETYTKYIHPLDKSNRTIFGDGAAVCLVSKEIGIAEIEEFVLGTDGSGAENLIIKTEGARIRTKSGYISEDDDGHMKRDDYLYMNGSAIFNFTLETVPKLINDLYAKCNICSNDIDYYIFHQANKYMLNTIRKVCLIPNDKFYNNLEDTGNTVSSTILIALKNCLDNKIIYSGMQVMISGFGVGLSYGGSILRVI